MGFVQISLIGVISVVFLVLLNLSLSFAGHVVYKGNTSVCEGERFVITCNLTMFDPVKWEKDGVALVPDLKNKYVFEEENEPGGGILARLEVDSALPLHSGIYRCNSFHNESHLLIVSANELQANYDFQEYKVLEYKQQLVLECNITGPPTPQLTIKWFKNDKPVVKSEGEKPRIVITDKKLIINRAVEEDVANYTCQLFSGKSNTSAPTIKRVFQVIGKPFVRLPRTITVVEGEKLVLECIVLGKPTPVVEWRFGNTTYDKSIGRVNLKDDTEKGIPNAIFQIDQAQLSDRGEYFCSAHNIANHFVNSTEAVIFVRIKDKLAALWPFLGICAEVIVLCAVIFIYEKKRNKAELEESDTDQSPEQKNTPDHGKDSVRQRK